MKVGALITTPSIQLSMKRILIIEDNSFIRENFVEFLNMSGFKILSANNGKEGIEMAREYLPDLIICDVLMPVMDGYEVLRLLQNKPDTYLIPFIFSTSKSEKIDYAEGMRLGADDYLVKPFEMETLLNKIEMWLKSGSRRQNLPDTKN
jgi:CheY-like chemotaxis protein